MKIKMNIEKKHLYIFAIIAALLTAGVFATARFAGTSGVGHDSSEVGVTINGQTVSLQQAINQGLIGGGGSSAIMLQGREKSSTGADIIRNSPNRLLSVTRYNCWTYKRFGSGWKSLQ